MMQHDLAVSVIIPSFNRRESLRVAIDALDQQDCASSEYEVIVVDDGSDDGTAEMLHRLAQSLRYRLVVLRSDRSGPGLARNRAIGIARGEVLLFTDSDCIPDTTWISALAGLVRTTGSPVGGKIEVGTDARWSAQIVNCIMNSWLGGFGKRWRIFGLVPGYRLRTMNAGVLRASAESVGRFRCTAGCYGEDTEFGEALERQGMLLHHCDAAVVVHEESRKLPDHICEAFAKGAALAKLTWSGVVRMRGVYCVPVMLVALLAWMAWNLAIHRALSLWSIAATLTYLGVLYFYAIGSAWKLRSIVPVVLLPAVAVSLHVSYGVGVILGSLGLRTPAKGVNAPVLRGSSFARRLPD